MDKLSRELKFCSVKEIYCSDDCGAPVEYRIPVYQRNYAWGRDEIYALIEDVCDSWKKSGEDVYYIGTLVTFKRDENVFEVIDGQQRLTTIFIILRALKVEVKSELTYSARTASTETIKAMSKSMHDDSKKK